VHYHLFFLFFKDLGHFFPSAYDAGKGFGTSLSALYTQYKSTRKVDLTDATTVINLATLATCSTTIKGNMKNQTFYRNFASGAIAGSGNLITNATVSNVITLVNSMDLSALAAGKNVSSTPASITNTLLAVFGLFGK